MAAELGYRDLAYAYFVDAAVMDLGDIGGNVRDGLHIASLAGTWLALVYGFAGLRVRRGVLHFRPRLPEGWRRLRFTLAFRGRRLAVTLFAESIEYRLLEGESLVVHHVGESLLLQPGAAVERPCGEA